MVGNKGKPVTIRVEGNAVVVAVEGKAEERLVDGKPAEVSTPRGNVMATLALAKRAAAFTVRKVGPAEGELTVEERTLIDDDTLRCVFTHHNPKTGEQTSVVRVYTRRAG